MNNDPARYWCFTHFGYNDKDLDNLKSISELVNCRYIIAGHEICPKTGRPHLQGYLEFKPAIRFKRLSGKLPGVHLEKRYKDSTAEHCITYCKKDKEYVEYGSPIKGPGQGHRSDLDNCRKRIREGETEEQIADAHFGSWCRYRKAFRRYRSLIAKKRTNPPVVIVHTGPPGGGKTRACWDKYPELNSMKRENAFWSDYDGEDVVLWDDFDATCCSRVSLLQLLDRYPCKIRQLGCYVEWFPKTILITTNKHPRDWFVDELTTTALLRRITKIIEYPKNK